MKGTKYFGFDGEKRTMSHVFPVAHGSHSRHPLCIPHLLTQWAESTPDALAILAPERPPLIYSRLWRHVHDIVQTLRTLGVQRHDRGALVLPNGPEMAVAFLTVTAAAPCACPA